MTVTREDLIGEYDRLSLLLVKAGGDPVVLTRPVLEVFTDGELKFLVKDTARQLMRIRWAQQ